jgi:tripartite-type tricarboxylate transporter receptor subunit TctC
MIVLRLVLSCFCLLGPPACSAGAQETVNFRGQSISNVMGFPAGGGVDATGRLVGAIMAQYLPGQPTIVARYMPGANGVVSLNYLVQQTKPDGLTFTTGAGDQLDPINYRKPEAHYDPSKFHFFGGVGRGGYALLIRSDAEKRLYDKSAAPVVMGAIGAWPRPAMQVTLWGVEYLGWNARWVTGYRGTTEVMLALERGEIDMTATGNLYQINALVDSGKFRIVNQSGALENGKFVGRPDFRGAPLLTDQLRGKVNDPIGQRALRYWSSINAMDKFLALGPGTPMAVVDSYRDAFRRTAEDPKFSEQGKRISEDFAPMSYRDVEGLVAALADTPAEVIDYLTTTLTRQGLKSAR